ncbi:ATP-grasp domain-containing protein [Bacillus sp. 7894-2]|uniref:ATP-grasp domain-containing protein n=1 Tax=Bacillus sp. 7894-2 TaxID=2021695 RepID=UPI000BA6C916|nr:ATP-grasp domain-containing protein [Bacillus sp. 7894-2]PAE25784.1 hypothetical protein CHI10_05745 [Bacillus sp. 7894-2]
MKKILIIGSSTLQLPAIIRAKELGYSVTTIDYNPNAIGIKYADSYFNVSTIDIEGVLKVAKQIKPDGIMTLGTDMPVRSLAVATSELGLPGISLDAAIKSTDKGEMIKTFEKHNVETPWFHIINEKKELDDISKKLKYPCIIKPTDNSGSRGVILVNKKEELIESYLYSKKHSRNGAVIIEEFMIGKEVSVEIMIIDGQPNILAVTDKLTTGAPYFVEMGHSQQSQLNREQIEQIKNLSIKAVGAVGIKNGPAHVEIILTPEGPKMVELGARMGGDFITTHLVPLSTGIDMVEATIRTCIGENPKIKPKFNNGSAILYLDIPNGTIKSIDGIEAAREINGIRQVTILKTIGDTVEGIKSSSDRVGFVIAQSDNAEKAINICKEAINRINIKVDKVR